MEELLGLADEKTERVQTEAAARSQELELVKAEKSSLEIEFRRLYAKDTLNDVAGKALLERLEKLEEAAIAAEAFLLHVETKWFDFLELPRIRLRLRTALDALRE